MLPRSPVIFCRTDSCLGRGSHQPGNTNGSEQNCPLWPEKWEGEPSVTCRPHLCTSANTTGNHRPERPPRTKRGCTRPCHVTEGLVGTALRLPGPTCQGGLKMQVSYHSTNVSWFQLKATSYEKPKDPKGDERHGAC